MSPEYLAAKITARSLGKIWAARGIMRIYLTDRFPQAPTGAKFWLDIRSGDFQSNLDADECPNASQILASVVAETLANCAWYAPTDDEIKPIMDAKWVAGLQSLGARQVRAATVAAHAFVSNS